MDFTYLGNSLAIETEGDSAHWLISMLNIKVDLVGDFGTFGCFDRLAHEEECGGQNDHHRDDEVLDVRHV